MGIWKGWSNNRSFKDQLKETIEEIPFYIKEVAPGLFEVRNGDTLFWTGKKGIEQLDLEIQLKVSKYDTQKNKEGVDESQGDK